MLLRALALVLTTLVTFGVTRTPAIADPVDVTAGASLNLLTGKHDIGYAVHYFTLIPLPLGEFEVRAFPVGLRIEGFPPLAGSASDSTTRLSIVNGTLRLYAPRRAFFAGLGETVYNQMTVDGPNSIDPNRNHSSRVTGLRVEAGAGAQFSANDRLELIVAANPKMHGIIHTTEFGRTFDDPESASQVDVALRRIIRHGSTEFVYGVRYLNFAAHYEAMGRSYDGSLADRNVGAMPVIGWRWRL